MDNLGTMIKFTHHQTNRPTYLVASHITGVRENMEGKTLILSGESGQYVKEPVDEVLETLSIYGFEVV